MSINSRFYFFLIGKSRNILEKGTKRKTQKHTGSIQKGPLRYTQEKRKNKLDPYPAPSQSIKLGKVRGPSFTIDFVHTHRLQTKEFFNL